MDHPEWNDDLAIDICIFSRMENWRRFYASMIGSLTFNSSGPTADLPDSLFLPKIRSLGRLCSRGCNGCYRTLCVPSASITSTSYLALTSDSLRVSRVVVRPWAINPRLLDFELIRFDFKSPNYQHPQ